MKEKKPLGKPEVRLRMTVVRDANGVRIEFDRFCLSVTDATLDDLQMIRTRLHTNHRQRHWPVGARSHW